VPTTLFRPTAQVEATGLGRMLEGHQRELVRLTYERRQKVLAAAKAARLALREELEQWLKRPPALVGGQMRKPAERFTAQHLRVAQALAENTVATLTGTFNEVLVDGFEVAGGKAVAHAAKEISRFREVFEGVEEGVNIDAMLAMADERELLLLRFQASVETYGRELISRIQAELVQGAMARSTATKLIGRVTGTGGVFARQHFRAARIVRTELSAAYNTTALAAYEQVRVEEEMWDLGKTLIGPRDRRTAEDSLRIDGQVVELDKPFRDPGTGQEFMAPPNRPNDRARLLSWRRRWGDPRQALGQGPVAPPPPALDPRRDINPETVRAEVKTEAGRIGRYMREAKAAGIERKTALRHYLTTQVGGGGGLSGAKGGEPRGALARTPERLEMWRNEWARMDRVVSKRFRELVKQRRVRWKDDPVGNRATYWPPNRRSGPGGRVKIPSARSGGAFSKSFHHEHAHYLETFGRNEEAAHAFGVSRRKPGEQPMPLAEYFSDPCYGEERAYVRGWPPGCGYSGKIDGGDRHEEVSSTAVEGLRSGKAALALHEGDAEQFAFAVKLMRGDWL